MQTQIYTCNVQKMYKKVKFYIHKEDKMMTTTLPEKQTYYN